MTQASDARFLAHALAGESGLDAAAAERARASSGDAEARLLHYFSHHAKASAMRAALARVRRHVKLIGLATGVLAFCAGALTARTALAAGPNGVVNIFYVLLAILGLQILAFAVWLAVMTRGPQVVRANSLGGALITAAGWLTARWDKDSPAAVTAVLTRLSGGPAARWSASVMSHYLWTAFLIGALAAVLLLLSIQQYYFVWETTILSAERYRQISLALSAPLQALGFAVPDAATLAASQYRGQGIPKADPGHWSGFLIGSVLVYGLLPRAVALGVSAWRARRLALHRPLDLSLPAFARLAPQLAPLFASQRPAPASAPQQPAVLPRRAETPDDPSRRAAFLGWEIDPPMAGWPPAPGRDLGLVDGATQAAGALQALAQADAERLIIVADLTQTPDRGVTAGLAPFVDEIPVAEVWLTGGARLDRRLGPAEARARREDWVAAAHAAGLALDRIVERDLDQGAAA
ncbi:MAG: DUF2868 domain-containing protein [Rhodothalassiaceae bacterium]